MSLRCLIICVNFEHDAVWIKTSCLEEIKVYIKRLYNKEIDIISRTIRFKIVKAASLITTYLRLVMSDEKTHQNFCKIVKIEI